MEKAKLYTLITISTALEGSTLTLEQNTRLLDEGVSSEGKTIAEQLLNLGVRDAYLAALKDAEEHQMWNSYRIKKLAAKALGSFGFDTSRVGDEARLQGICQEANEARMHAHSLGASGLAAAAESIRDHLLGAELWPDGNGIMARLLMNMLQAEFGLDMGCTGELPAARTVKTSTRILEILTNHPRYTTADLAETLGISAKGVEKHLAKLKKMGTLQRIGPDKGGHWQVLRIL